MIEFAWPYLFAALPLPLLVALLSPRTPRLPSAALRVPFFAALRNEPPTQRRPRARLPMLLATLAWMLLIIAAARPQWVGEPLRLPVTGREILLAVDLSGSMEIEDMTLGGRPVSRLQAVKAVAGDFIQRRLGDRLGLILFGTRPYLQTPLTFDRTTVRTLLYEAEIGLAGKETAIGDAIGLAIKRLKDRPRASRVLILLTDGANTAGEMDPVRAAELAAQAGLRIHTIGVGADELLMRTPFGVRRINPATDLDERTLSAIAVKTGGQYFRARDTDSLMAIYRLLDELEPSAKQPQIFRPAQELYPWPLAAALALTMILAVAAGVDRRPEETLHAR